MEERARLGMAMFLVSDAVLFLFLIIGVVYFKERAALASAGIACTILLAASSITMWRAASGAALRIWLTATILLAAGSLWAQGLGGFPATPALLTLLGCHHFHIALGVVLLGIALWRGSSVIVKTIALYWYFVVAVWIAIVAIRFIV